MKAISIPRATEIYSDASQCEILRHYVDHSGLGELSRLIKKLVQTLDGEEGEYCRKLLGPIRRTGFALCSTPLPFAKVADVMGLDWVALDRLVQQGRLIYPDAHAMLEASVQQMKRLCQEESSPVLTAIEDLVNKHGPLSIVVRNQSMNRLVAEFFSKTHSLKKASVVSAAQLRGAHQCKRLVTIGPSGWFPEYFFTAPRAVAIHIITYKWIRDTWKPGPVLLHQPGSDEKAARVHQIGVMPRVSEEKTAEAETANDGFLEPRDLLPQRLALEAIGNQTGSSDAEETAELIAARLCQISGNRGVFVPAGDGASTLVIDTSATGNAVARRVLVDDLEPGLFVILRTSGGGDFIAPLADRLLAKLAIQRRSQQAEWKNKLLSAATDRFGARKRRELASLVCSYLQTHGLGHVCPANLYYWMSSKCIRPRKLADFAAALQFSGLSERVDEFWSAMGDIDRAHRRAGHSIRQMLLRKIAATSMDLLERDGEMIFDLGEQDGGSLTAYQIEDILAQNFEIPSDRIGVLLSLEE